MEQATKWRNMRGAKGDLLVEGYSLANQAWGRRCLARNSGVTAMAYMFRRFGPPFTGTDPYKTLCSYYLTTADKDVILNIDLSGSSLAYAVGYIASITLHAEHMKKYHDWGQKCEEYWWSKHPKLAKLEDTPENSDRVSKLYWKDRMNPEWTKEAEKVIGPWPGFDDPTKWKKNKGVIHRVNKALYDALKELERPVFIRDVPINIFGRCRYVENECEPSKYSGFGVSKRALDRLVGGEVKCTV